MEKTEIIEFFQYFSVLYFYNELISIINYSQCSVFLLSFSFLIESNGETAEVTVAIFLLFIMRYLAAYIYFCFLMAQRCPFEDYRASVHTIVTQSQVTQKFAFSVFVFTKFSFCFY